MRFKALSAGTLVILLSSIMVGARQLPANAATTSPAISVNPALQNLVALPGQKSLSYQASVTNNSGQNLTVVTSSADFTSLGNNGNLVFQNKNNANGLASSLVPDATNFTLAPHQTLQLTVQVVGLVNLGAGGHYAALLFQASNGAADVASQSRVSFKQSVASLVFLTTAGQGTYQLQLAPLSVGLQLLHQPSQYDLLFTNTGNVQTTPRGYINVTTPFGKQVSKTIINPNSALVLPGTKRLLQTTVSSTGHALWPGIYTVKVFYRADGAANFTTSTSHFFYLGLPTTLLIIFVFGLVLFRSRKHIFRTRKSKS